MRERERDREIEKERERERERERQREGERKDSALPSRTDPPAGSVRLRPPPLSCGSTEQVRLALCYTARWVLGVEHAVRGSSSVKPRGSPGPVRKAKAGGRERSVT